MNGCPDADVIVQYATGVLTQLDRGALEQHLDGCADCRELLREANAGMQATAADGEVAFVPGAALQRGAPVGRYMVLSLLGEGGLGRVYLAYDPELDRKLAIKLLRDRSVDAEGLAARLTREGQAMARLSHPHVVPVFDFGLSEFGPYIAMAVVEGGTLRTWLAARPRSWQEIRDAFVEAGAGLAAAHRVGLVHRDFKPSNVLVDAEGRMMVTDFGLARASEEHSGDAPEASFARVPRQPLLDATLTRTGTVMGTPAYVAPEQLRGRTVDARADQFSFCISLYEALYGIRPFVADDAHAYLDAIARGETRTPTARRDVPAALRRAVLRGLAEDPAARHPDMAALLRAMTWDRRARRRYLAITLGAIVLAGAGVGIGLSLRTPTPIETTAVDAIVDEARAAAAEARFLYPAADDPARPTAYQRVLALEALGGGEHEQALAAASTLRQEFSTTLTRLGDEYWARDGGRPFAADYYLAATVFDPDNRHAATRMMVTPGELASLRERASAADFSGEELVAAEPLAVLADPEPERRMQRARAILDGGAAPASVLARLEDIVQPTPAPLVSRAPASRAAATPAPAPESPPPAASTGDGGSDGGESGDATPASAAPAAASDPAAAAREITAGRAAIRANDLAVAEQHFHRALRLQRGAAEALAGLAEVHFERGEFPLAVEFGDRAVRARPRNGRYRIALGDAYMRTLEYDAARREYEAAQSLGESRAAARLQALRARLGG
ncbi:MAG: serine/threonine protein kinase [Nannocystaceae bacterium]|nr:serine/threonine protein kinase [Nannocystaceae bacterium]